jgi:hypothetical protein
MRRKIIGYQMRRKIISYQKAVAICKQEGLDFSKIKEHGPFLLKTGAKLGYSLANLYAISGYAYDGSDVEPYVPFEYGIEIKTKEPLAALLGRTGLVEYDGETLVIWVPSEFKDPESFAVRMAEHLGVEAVRR